MTMVSFAIGKPDSIAVVLAVPRQQADRAPRLLHACVRSLDRTRSSPFCEGDARYSPALFVTQGAGTAQVANSGRELSECSAEGRGSIATHSPPMWQQVGQIAKAYRACKAW